MSPEVRHQRAMIRHYRHQFPQDAFCAACVFAFILSRILRFKPAMPETIDMKALRRAYERAEPIDTEVRADILRTVSILETIPATMRTALLLRSWHKLSYRDIATRTGIPESMVGPLIIRARLLMVYYGMDAQPLSNRPVNSGSA